MKRLDTRLEVLLWIGLFAIISLTGNYVFKQPHDTNDQARLVRIGYVSWAEGIAMTYLAQAVLEEKMGYEVELTMADPAPIFTSLSGSNLDFFLDAWLPVTHQQHMEEYGEVLVDLGYNYRGARIGLVVPSYIDIDTIPELAENESIVNGAITGIDSGAGIMEATQRAIEQYDMDMELLTSSGAAMTASLKDAIQDEESIVVTGWKPHWMFARWNLKFLDDPRTVYGEVENLHTLARPGISQDMPELVNFFKEFSFTDQQIGSLMDAMNQSESQAKAARTWMQENHELIDSWLKKSK